MFAYTKLMQAMVGAGTVTDPQFYLTTLLLNTSSTNGAQNNTFLDSSSNAFTITRNGNTTQGTFTPFSQTGWSGNFNTSTTYLTVTDTANLRFGSANFTIEAWVYRAASGAVQTIASKGASTPTGWVFQISAADKLVFTDTSTSITGATSIAANTWYYVAVVRAGTGASQTTLYVNGTSDATGTSATNFNQTNNMLIGADRSSLNFANGYISNLRLSNTNRTISSTPTTALTADANTIFLALNSNWFQYTDNTSAYTAMSVTGTPSVQAFSPFAPTAAYSTSVVGGSGYFDGTGDYLQAAANVAFDITQVDGTIEAWVYRTVTGVVQSICNYRGGSTGWELRITAANVASFYFTGGSSITGATAIPANTWTHVAFSRSGTTGRLFVNGVLDTTNSSFTNGTAASGAVLRVGADENATPASLFTGYIANERLIKGAAVYTGAFTPPTLPLSTSGAASASAYPSTTNVNTSFAASTCSLLLNFTNAGIYDAAAKNDLETIGNAQVSTTQAKFGTTSMYFDGSADYLTSTNINNALGTGDFTIEFWINGTYSGTKIILDWASTPQLYMSNTSLIWYWNANRITGTLTSNTWQHVAIVRSGGVTKMYIDGTANATTWTDSTSITVQTLTIGGRAADITNTLNGYIDELRITKYARYTGATLTVPTAAFPVQ